MDIRCPHCGKLVAVKGIGRKRLNIPVNKVYDALKNSQTVGQAAEKLNCSRGYIYQVLKQEGKNPEEVRGIR